MTGDPVAALKKYEYELVESVMARSRTVYQDYESDVSLFLSIFYHLICWIILA